MKFQLKKLKTYTGALASLGVYTVSLFRLATYTGAFVRLGVYTASIFDLATYTATVQRVRSLSLILQGARTDSTIITCDRTSFTCDNNI